MSTYASIPYSSQNRGLFCLIPDDTRTFKEGLKAAGIIKIMRTSTKINNMNYCKNKEIVMTLIKRRPFIAFVLPWIVLLVLAGCATVGRQFPVDPVSKIQIGKTTQDDIRGTFGQPWRTGLEDGKTTWTYGYYKYRLFGSSITRDLVVRFDNRGVVASYSFSTNETGGE